MTKQTSFFCQKNRKEKRSFNAEKRIRTVFFHSGAARDYINNSNNGANSNSSSNSNSNNHYFLLVVRNNVLLPPTPLSSPLSLSLSPHRESLTHISFTISCTLTHRARATGKFFRLNFYLFIFLFFLEHAA